jgi:hypothetical protein
MQIGQGADGVQGAAGSNNAGAGSGSSSSSGSAGAVASSAECSYVKKRIGFRTVELVTDPLDKAVKVSLMYSSVQPVLGGQHKTACEPLYQLLEQPKVMFRGHICMSTAYAQRKASASQTDGCFAIHIMCMSSARLNW